MSAAVVAGVAVFGGVGAVARWGVTRAVTARAGGPFPFGTLVVNLTGAFLLGLLVGATTDRDALRLLGTGLLGGYTTFSTWMVESRPLRPGLLVTNIGGSLVLGVLAVWLGRGIA